VLGAHICEEEGDADELSGLKILMMFNFPLLEIFIINCS
jgi:hypothetical protein